MVTSMQLTQRLLILMVKLPRLTYHLLTGGPSWVFTCNPGFFTPGGIKSYIQSH